MDWVFRIAASAVRISPNTRKIWTSTTAMVKYLTQKEAIEIDLELFNNYKFSVDQLMELAGLSCASVIAKCYSSSEFSQKPLLICCGPGNNGGDGLVCARHLRMFGFNPTVYYPKSSEKVLFKNLVHQCQMMNIEVSDNFHCARSNNYGMIVDALFGFSFKPPIRDEFKAIMDVLANTTVPIISVDIPSGWDVELGPLNQSTAICPDTLISLTAPKLCARYFKGRHHYLGGRFIPEDLDKKYNLNIPTFINDNCYVSLN